MDYLGNPDIFTIWGIVKRNMIFIYSFAEIFRKILVFHIGKINSIHRPGFRTWFLVTRDRGLIIFYLGKAQIFYKFFER
ncbi:MAG: hypothetical protein CVV33_00840 [Methanomicrobiales archaeon HGW-Methanomicrobiales-4]|nr:MAG: hypothetical protein CVV33_00840 [Methanomicrobiales archaeon HGW-Methanomicrobiales-4]